MRRERNPLVGFLLRILGSDSGRCRADAVGVVNSLLYSEVEYMKDVERRKVDE